MAMPTVYDENVAERILERVAQGESVRKICETPGYPSKNVVAIWVYRDFKGFGSRFYEAFSARCALMAEEVVSIPDEAHGGDMPTVQSARNRADVRKWLLSKLIPAHFGERVDHRMQISGQVNVYVPDNSRMMIEGHAEMVEEDDA